MRFLDEIPSVALVEHTCGKYTTFAANLFDPRPDWESLRSFEQRALLLEEAMQRHLEKTVCPFTSVVIYVDKNGGWIVAETRKRMQVCNAQKRLDTVIQSLDQNTEEAAVRRNVERTFRAFDELDQRRLRDFFIARPRSTERERPTPTSLQALIDEESDEEEASPLLSIEDLGGEAEEDDLWLEGVRELAVVIFAHAGEPPPLYGWVHCIREERREELLRQGLPATPKGAQRAKYTQKTPDQLPQRTLLTQIIKD